MEKLWTVTDVSQCLGISEADVQALVRAGRLTAHTQGGRFIRFQPEQVRALKDAVGASASHAASRAIAAPYPWHERALDLIYFYDFYFVSVLLFVAVVFYLMASS